MDLNVRLHHEWIYDRPPRQLPADRSTARGRAIADWEEQIRFKPLEYGAFFDAAGNKHLERQGEPKRIGFTQAELKQVADMTFCHNHPDALSFSEADVDLARKANLSEIRVVTRYGCYVMVRPQAGWPSANEMSTAFAKAMDIADSTTVRLLCHEGLNKRYAQIEYQHQVWRAFSTLLSIAYRREPLT
ncbi:hypothetical protein [Parachitinimonas caeni]|uniref:Uncharacterized protein n=1 Tax=Parachitinimonas caeni TaxID=3031301 RepID=A0ABT7E159_9NEIS|nr:hypothetical protein [Parachitinimonas caeni]MDK2126048.1 hypothetical protein [Parachitinimonas caeni]